MPKGESNLHEFPHHPLKMTESMEKFRPNILCLKGRKSSHQFHQAEMEQRSPDILIGIGKIRVERMITLSLRSVVTSWPFDRGSNRLITLKRQGDRNWGRPKATPIIRAGKSLSTEIIGRSTP